MLGDHVDEIVAQLGEVGGVPLAEVLAGPPHTIESDCVRRVPVPERGLALGYSAHRPFQMEHRRVRFFAALGRFREGVYVNFLGGDEGPDRVREAYGGSIYDRLVDVKTTYDPDNVFHHNQNIRPRTGTPISGGYTTRPH